LFCLENHRWNMHERCGTNFDLRLKGSSRRGCAG
jgi:hypothetical protein